MKPKGKFLQLGSQWLSLLLSGAGVGALTGLSASPVVGGVLTALLGVISGLLAGAAGVSFHSDSADSEQGEDSQSMPPAAPFQVDARPCAILIMGVILGAVSGLYVRTHNWLGVMQSGAASKTLPQTQDHPIISIYALGTDTDALKALVREASTGGAQSPVHRPEAESAPPAAFTQGVLFANSPPRSECETFRAKQGDALRAELETSSSAFVQRFSKNCSDDACLKALVDTLCPASH